MFFLRDANHQFAHSVISVFYSKLLGAQPHGSTAISAASKEFVSICKATASFFTLWMGSLQGRFPDSVYRDMFQNPGANMSVFYGQSNQTEMFVKEIFRRALESESAYQNGNKAKSRQLWISKAKGNPWYLRRAVCKFGLFAATHDAAPDTAGGKEGLFTNGKPNSASFLNCKSWHSSDYEVIEHVATRDKPSSINYPSHFDTNVYPGNNSVVDRIGNLTLLSVQVNSSIYSEWPDKVFYYWSLTKPQSTSAGPAASALKAALGLTTVPPGLASLSASSNYLPQLAPLAHRGIIGKKWDVSFIDERSEHLCGRIFDKLEPWLS